MHAAFLFPASKLQFDQQMKSKRKSWVVERSAINGQFVKAGTAKRRPRTTIIQRIQPR